MPRSRVTVIENVYHQTLDGKSQPFGVQSQFTRMLEGDEQVYQRRIKVGPQWQPLDLGWVKSFEVAMVVVSNEEGKGLQVIPTPEERATIDSKVVELCYSEDIGIWLIPPGENFRGTSSRPTAILVRCLGGEAKCIVTIIPK